MAKEDFLTTGSLYFLGLYLTAVVILVPTVWAKTKNDRIKKDNVL